MSESFLERLSRFSPDPGRLDRDSLLFAAGYSAARSHRGWRALAFALACTQTLSLLVLLPHAIPPTVGPSQPLATGAGPHTKSEAAISRPSPGSGLWTARDRLRNPELDDRAGADMTLIDGGPPLRAFARLDPSLVN